ncbi:MAG: 50S ribosomal protein L9 [Bacteroidetes bacterium]|nr:50S ribosomal protein L9 [Bacteroidota bacterium]
MKIILKQDVYNLGEEGDICVVADGYARNYLIPKKIAVYHNNMNLAELKSKASAIAKRKEEKRKDALSIKEKIEELSLEIKVSAGDSGKLFGAVTGATIVEALSKEGIHIEKKKLDVPSHTIKMVGNYSVKVRLYENEAADLKIVVVNERLAEIKEKKDAAASRASQVEVKSEFDDDFEEESDSLEVEAEELVETVEVVEEKEDQE